MEKTDLSRRTYLKSSGPVLVGALSGAAGCNTLNGGEDTDTTSTNATTRTRSKTDATGTASRADTTDSGGSNGSADVPYVSMVPVPSDPSAFDFSFYQYDAIREQRSNTVPSTGEADALPLAGGFEIPFEKMDTFLMAEVDVVTGSFSNESIIATLQQRSDAALQEKYKGYDIYVERDGGSANAFSNEALISHMFTDPSLPVMKATIDVMNGDGERFYDANTDFQSLVDTLGSGAYASGTMFPDSNTGGIRADVGRGMTLTTDGERPVFSLAIVFENTDAADTETVREWLTAKSIFSSSFANPDDVTVERDGRVVTATGEANTQAQQPPSATETPAQTTDLAAELSPLTMYTKVHQRPRRGCRPVYRCHSV